VNDIADSTVNIAGSTPIYCAWCGSILGRAIAEHPVYACCPVCARKFFPGRPVQADPTRCPKCGGPLIRQRCGVSDGMTTGAHCLVCGVWRDFEPPKVVKRRPTPARLDERVPCKVVGCQNRVQVSTTTTGMCHECNRRVRDWQNSAKTKPAPIIEFMGEMIFNPARK
jgi:hypothetical protein